MANMKKRFKGNIKKLLPLISISLVAKSHSQSEIISNVLLSNTENVRYTGMHWEMKWLDFYFNRFSFRGLIFR